MAVVALAAATTVAGEAPVATSAVVAAAAATSVAAAVAAATLAKVAAAVAVVVAVAAAVEMMAAEALPRGSRYAFVARASPSRLCFARFALVAGATHSDLGFALVVWLRPHTTIKQHRSGRKRCFGSATTYLPQW